ncbi:MAG: N-6 DNA methylase, partial [Thermoguttaceae bacterium]|nr:N-6 DNA methylase [Thermoguttaceae bacterium]
MARKTTNTKKSPAAQKRRRAAGGFSNIRVEGELLPLELLSKIAVGDPSIEGLTSEDYGLFENQTINEKATEVWENLKQAWKKFRAQAKSLPKDASGAKATYDLWLKALLATGLGYQLRADEAPQTIGETAYPISHSAMFFAASGQKTVPVHIVSFRQDLDKRDPSCARSPMSLAQEYLNQRGGVLWGILTNGLRLRLLRENPSVARPAFVEFDLETIFDGDFYGDFSLFYLLCHASRLRPIDEAVSVGGAEPSGEDDDSAGDENGDDEGEDTEGAAGPAVVTSTCYLEKYRAAARIEGVRVYDTLRVGVREAIKHLGRGFLTHPDNDFIKQKFESGSLTLQDFYHELLRLVYRIIFLFIAEDRDLIFGPEVSKEKRLIYDKFYSMNRFRAMAPKVGGQEKDLWIALRDIFRRFASGEERLGVPALGSTLFSPQFTPHLDKASLDNSSLMAAVWLLAYTDINGCRQSVNYKNLGTEELGSIYEALLEMRPHRDTGDFDLSDGVSGNERKTSGSYYTPPELVASLVESALVPVMEQRLRAAKTKKAQIEAILSMKVCDPTCGSGHFLLGAAHRMGHRLAQIRSGESSPTGEAYRQGVRDVIAHCIYGADINPMAVELCKVSLWIESMVPNKAMMFLDHRIRCGNTFLGAWRDLVKQGIPDGAYTPLEGDSKALCAQLKKANAGRRDGYRDLELEPDRQAEAESESPEALAAIDSAANETADDYETKSARYAVYLKGEKHRRDKDLFDLWSAAFLWPKKDDRDDPPTHDDLRGVQNKGIFNLTQKRRETLKELVKEYQFFHWELEFPEVFTPERGGFDVVVGNPPWETLELKEKEFFAARCPDISEAKTAEKRKQLINKLRTEDPPLYADYFYALRHVSGLRQLFTQSGRFQRDQGKDKTYQTGKINNNAVYYLLSR